jgi:CheY-like chemotaxis protein
MNDDVKSKIFDPFFTTKFTGRGLGMAAMLGIVRGHNGIIELNSKLQKGTTFRIMFPANLEKMESLKKHDDNKSSENEWRGKGTLLIADDEVTICTIGKYMLEQAGFKVLTAYDGIEAVDIFREHADDIICVILDLTMPHLSGEEVFKEMNDIKPGVKVILSSGYDEQDAMQRFSSDEIAGFVQKPYTFEVLKEKIKNIL